MCLQHNKHSATYKVKSHILFDLLGKSKTVHSTKQHSTNAHMSIVAFLHTHTHTHTHTHFDGRRIGVSGGFITVESHDSMY
ncbi:hypothetical protein K431DRAFT_68537 [Polychaeton citri CBS 116435]|uniref:Uncharacterized protein n=1 Tax=Polychaeton citri CBS 116435 TaxID=1314669 RepID=A0A9P4QAX8_9PEZI|nr:hypothetical protein K431DRAFT_68537 [Polychaeton citri CBS 116435]